MPPKTSASIVSHKEKLFEQFGHIQFDTFRTIWGFKDKEPMIFDEHVNKEDKWNVVYIAFFGPLPPGEVKKYNSVYNEIREIGLLNLFHIPYTFDTYFNAMSSNVTKDIKGKLIKLGEEWITCLTGIAAGKTILSLQQMGGRANSWDFTLTVCNNPKTTGGAKQSSTKVKKTIKKGPEPEDDDDDSHDIVVDDESSIIKVEFKYNADKINDLPQFAAFCTESINGKVLLTTSYLNYFYDNDLQKICDIDFKNLKINKPGDKKAWIKTAAVTAVPKGASNELKEFHESLRDGTIKGNKDKKRIANESFANFIAEFLPSIKTDAHKQLITDILNKQNAKHYCLFNSTSGKFATERMGQSFDIKDIVLNPKVAHSFTLQLTEMNNFNVNCSMSWGNGGAGNQNPRVQFKMVPKHTKTPKNSGGSASLDATMVEKYGAIVEFDDTDDDFNYMVTKQDLVFFDTGRGIREAIHPISNIIGSMDMHVLRNGKTYDCALSGGGRYRKTKKRKQKRRITLKQFRKRSMRLKRRKMH